MAFLQPASRSVDAWSAVVPSANAELPTRLWIATLATPVGELRIVCTAAALCTIDYGDGDDRMSALFRRRFGRFELIPADDPLGMRSIVQRYFAGDIDAVNAAVVNGGGSAYQQSVWSALRTIPAGQTRTYGELAVQIGGTHARAVGSANARNPVPIVVPCHRVIGADTALTGYAGGLARKAWLLDHERRHAGSALTLWTS